MGSTLLTSRCPLQSKGCGKTASRGYQQISVLNGGMCRPPVFNRLVKPVSDYSRLLPPSVTIRLDLTISGVSFPLRLSRRPL